MSAPGAKAGIEARLPALHARDAGDAPFHLDVGTPVQRPGGFPGLVSRPVGGAPLVEASFAHRAFRRCRRPATAVAQPGGEAFLGFPTGPDALVLASLGRVPARDSLGFQPGVAGTAGAVLLLGAAGTQAAVRQRFGLATFGTQTGRGALGGSAVETLAVLSALDLDITIGHVGILPAKPDSWGGRPADFGPAGRPRERACQPRWRRSVKMPSAR